MNRLLMTITAVAALGGAARADIPPPAVTACSGKQLGDACTIGGADGVCAMGKRRRIRHSDKKVIEDDAVVCRPQNTKKSSQRDGAAPFMLAFGCSRVAPA